MNELPILFKGPMVRAILDGRKTQTRRIAKYSQPPGCNGYWPAMGDGVPKLIVDGNRCNDKPLRCPYGAIGSRLWVRETWASSQPNIVAYRANGEAGAWMGDGGGGRLWVHHGYILEAPGYPFGLENLRTIGLGKFGGKWRPSIFMPRSLSRITLEITGVRVERLNDISEADARAEGAGTLPNPCGYADTSHFACCKDYPHSAKERFQNLWCKINGADSWAANPWVWVLNFQRLP